MFFPLVAAALAIAPKFTLGLVEGLGGGEGAFALVTAAFIEGSFDDDIAAVAPLAVIAERNEGPGFGLLEDDDELELDDAGSKEAAADTDEDGDELVAGLTEDADDEGVVADTGKDKRELEAEGGNDPDNDVI